MYWAKFCIYMVLFCHVLHVCCATGMNLKDCWLGTQTITTLHVSLPFALQGIKYSTCDFNCFQDFRFLSELLQVVNVLCTLSNLATSRTLKCTFSKHQYSSLESTSDISQWKNVVFVSRLPEIHKIQPTIFKEATVTLMYLPKVKLSKIITTTPFTLLFCDIMIFVYSVFYIFF